METFRRWLYRDLRLTLRRPGEWLWPLFLLGLACLLFALALGSEASTLRNAAPAVIWVSTMLAISTSVAALTEEDLQDGTLELAVVQGESMAAVSLARSLAHWLRTGLPFILISPLLGLLMQTSPQTIKIMALTLLLGTPTLSLIGGIAGALSAMSKKGAYLAPLIMLPLVIPVLIFSATAVESQAAGLTVKPQLLFLSAILILTLALAPWAQAAALRLSVEESS